MSLNYPVPNVLPVSAIAQDDNAFSGPPHRHPDAQLIYAKSGVVSVTTDNDTWVVPPNRAVWVPAMTEHATRSHGAVEFRTLFIHPEAALSLPKICGVVEVTPLLRELILRLVTLNNEPITPFARHVSELLLEELSLLPAEPLSLPIPTDARLRNLCLKLQRSPEMNISLEDAANLTGMSRRSFMRHFEEATGMTFGRWHQQSRLLAALPALAQGQTIMSVALDCGYQSVSAFTNAFKRSLGRKPSHYFSHKNNSLQE